MTDAAYDIDDMLPAIRNGLSMEGKLYAAPFYGESSMTMYRADLVKAAGLTMPANPTWAEMANIVAKINDPAKGVYGLCLRGKPGWGDNMAFLSTMVNTYGGQWFDMAWKPQIDTKPWHDAINQYVDLMKKYGPRRFGQQLQRKPGLDERRQVRRVDRCHHCSFVRERSQAVQSG